MTRLDAGAAAECGQIVATIPFAALPADQGRSGSPATRYIDLDETDGRTIGVWEHTPGVSTDVEADEVFVVLDGAGTLSFEDPPLPDVQLRPGVMVRLAAGMRTTWSVRETLRKVYIAP